MADGSYNNNECYEKADYERWTHRNECYEKQTLFQHTIQISLDFFVLVFSGFVRNS